MTIIALECEKNLCLSKKIKCYLENKSVANLSDTLFLLNDVCDISYRRSVTSDPKIA